MAKRTTPKKDAHQLSFANTIIPKGGMLYFCESTHKYKDEFENIYTSVTTLIHNYVTPFDADKVAESCERIGKNPNHPKYLRYKGKSKKQIIYEWGIENKTACDKGTAKHNFLEDVIKSSGNFGKIKSNPNAFVKLYTIDDILGFHKHGKLNLTHKKIEALSEKYPKIHDILITLSTAGYKIYSEIAVYDNNRLVSGLIDVLCVKDDSFIIVDWKTNKAPIRFESGYFEKDNFGNLTDNYVLTNKFLKHPLSELPDSVGNHYALQLSTYATLAESFGLKCKGIILCHIRTIETGDITYSTDGTSVKESIDTVSYLNIPYIKESSEAMMNHFLVNRA